MDSGARLVLVCDGAKVPAALAGLPAAAVSERPGKTEVDPHLAGTRRLIVLGGQDNPDAALAAVATRMLRTERLDIELAYVPPRRTPGTRAWSLPHGAAAARAAAESPAKATPLIRDDSGVVLVGRARLSGPGADGLTGETYVDDARLFTGQTRAVLLRPAPRLGGIEASEDRLRKRWLAGRAAQTGSPGAFLERDGVPGRRALKRSSFYRHHIDWLLVHP